MAWALAGRNRAGRVKRDLPLLLCWAGYGDFELELSPWLMSAPVWKLKGTHTKKEVKVLSECLLTTRHQHPGASFSFLKITLDFSYENSDYRCVALTKIPFFKNENKLFLFHSGIPNSYCESSRSTIVHFEVYTSTCYL